MKSRIIYPVIITILVLLLAGCMLWNGAGEPRTYMLTADQYESWKKYTLTADQYESWQKLQRLEEIKSIIENGYYLPIEDESILYEGAYRGMVDALNDPYSDYVNEQQYQDLLDYSSGTFSGIGVILQQSKDEKGIVATKVLNNSPAQAVGMQEGDVFIAVDDVSTADMTMDDVVARVKGEKGTEVSVTVLRGTDELTFTIKRAEVHEPVVSVDMLDNNIAYVYLAQFSGGCADELIDKLKEVKAQGAKGFVLDLRFNPGGILSECVKICDFLLPKGRIVYEKNRDGIVQTYSSNANMFDLPFTVIVNEYSASAAEIAAGAFQVAKRAQIVGTTTYGKGVVQHYYNLNDKKTSVKLTASTYYLDNDQSPQDVGIIPDIKVDLPESVTASGEALTQENDTQLQRAIEALVNNM